ncbi:HD domain-containing protein [Hahella sp. KA22]|nr:HD domain-containing protein [Hahella sp. KA22]QAY57305.1 HD domain-containing protein [Hahella sp. KA22]
MTSHSDFGRKTEMKQYDPTTPDHYTNHLAEVNETNAVIATEDIYNKDGMLLVKKGLAIKPEVARRLLNHKLVKPLEVSVNVDDALFGQEIHRDIHQMFDRFEGLLEIHSSMRLEASLIEVCEKYGGYDLLVQKVTVLSKRLPKEYQKGLFCAWLSFAMATRLNLSNEEREAAFMAGLAHDAGMLHIDPQIVAKTGEYTPEEWRAMQSHTLIGDLFLSYIKEIPAVTRRAVKEHHERADGSGYPAGLFEDSLCIVGQVVAMADATYAICEKRRFNDKINLGEVMPVFQIDSSFFPNQVHMALMSVLRQVNHAATQLNISGDLSSMSAQLMEKRQMLEGVVESIYALRETLAEREHIKRMRVAKVKIDRLWTLVTRSGMLSAPLGRWLQHVVENQIIQTVSREIVEMDLMYQELQWQLKQLGRVLYLYLEEEKKITPELRKALANSIKILDMGAPKSMEKAEKVA